MNISSLLLSAILLFLPQAEAAGDMTCETILGLPSVSEHYTKRVLDRASAGITYAESQGVSDDIERYFPGWVKEVQTSWVGLIDSDQRLRLEEQDLPHISACLSIDLLQIECKMEEVRQKTHQFLKDGKFGAVIMMQNLLQFLNERRRHLQLGALDPLYTDPEWGNVHDFDPPAQVWCCPQDSSSMTCSIGTGDDCSAKSGVQFDTLSQCTAFGCEAPAGEDPKTSYMCPFNSNYAPPFRNGFGCDVETLQLLADYPPAAAELESLELTTEWINDYRTTALEFLEVQKQIDELFGNGSGYTLPDTNRQHLNAFGCGWSGGYCSGNQDLRCASDAECKGVGTCEVPTKVCENNRAIRCTSDANCGTFAPCIEGAELPAVRELRGPFSFNKDQITILQDFLGVRGLQELSRLFQSDLKATTEYGQGEDAARDDRASDDQNPLMKFSRSTGRFGIQAWSQIQAREEAFIYADAVDAQLEIADSLQSLRSAVSELSKLASLKTGVRQFVSRFAYFIRRSCVLRSCNAMLEQVIRITTTDECFPYTNGDYLKDDPNNPRWEKCKAAAEIQ